MQRYLSATVACLLLLISACVESTLVIESDLQHHRWVLESINGEPLPEGEPSEPIPELDFGEQMHVSGSTGCNRYSGKAVLRDGYFQIESLASTRKMCAPPANEMEHLFITMLGQDSRISIDGDKNLVLESGETVLIFCLRDWVR